LGAFAPMGEQVALDQVGNAPHGLVQKLSDLGDAAKPVAADVVRDAIGIDWGHFGSSACDCAEEPATASAVCERGYNCPKL